jgi:REP element-mobilizing transposase RayT
MPRPPRIQFEGATYHVFSRGNRRERIFCSEEDYAAFEGILLEAMRWSGVQLFNWSQMPNHVHFNVETPEGNLSEFIQRVFTRFAQYFNRTHHLVGHVFQGRYGARLVDQENHFCEIVRYVELNPYRLKKGKLAQLGAWKWSSLRYYLLPESQWPEGCRKAFQRVLERFGNDPASARKNLTKFLADGLASGSWEDFYRVRERRFVGDEAFIERVKQRNKEPVRQIPRVFMTGIGLGELIWRVQKLSGLSSAELAAGDKGQRASRWRQALAWVARRIYRIPLVRIAEALGRSESTVSMMVTRHQGAAKKRSELLELMNGLCRHDESSRIENVKCEH